MANWTPNLGARELAEEFGREQALEILAAILRREDLPDGLFLRVMTHIGNVHEATITGPAGWSSWFEFPETWAARALGYLGNSEEILLSGANHPHWRVRRQVIRSLGWVGGHASLQAITQAMQDDDERVRAQATVSEAKILGRGPNKPLSPPGERVCE